MMARIFGFISIHNISLRQWKLNYFEISEERLSYSLVKASDTTFKKKKKKKLPTLNNGAQDILCQYFSDLSSSARPFSTTK
jgi:hypothetical protein